MQLPRDDLPKASADRVRRAHPSHHVDPRSFWPLMRSLEVWQRRRLLGAAGRLALRLVGGSTGGTLPAIVGPRCVVARSSLVAALAVNPVRTLLLLLVMLRLVAARTRVLPVAGTFVLGCHDATLDPDASHVAPYERRSALQRRVDERVCVRA